MSAPKEALAADLVWRYVEQVRELEAAGEPVRFSRAELEELVELLATASAVPEALAAEDAKAGLQEADCRAAVRTRLETMLAAHRTAHPEPAAPERPARATQRSIPPVWKLRAALGAAAALALALATVDAWHPPKVVVKRMSVPRDVRGVEPIDEELAEREIPLMVRNELSPQDEKNLMWHMLVCPGCFDEYVRVKREAPMAGRPWDFAMRR